MTKLFSPSLPKPKPPAPMPDEDAIMAAKRRAVAQQMSKSGRDSTILSNREGL